jgi:hypothetical protein
VILVRNLSAALLPEVIATAMPEQNIGLLPDIKQLEREGEHLALNDL